MESGPAYARDSITLWPARSRARAADRPPSPQRAPEMSPGSLSSLGCGASKGADG